MKDQTQFEIDYYNTSLKRVVFNNKHYTVFQLFAGTWVKFLATWHFLKSIKTLLSDLDEIFPCSWKMAEASAILKDGYFEGPNNYRPISLLPLCHRYVSERIALIQLTPYLLSNERLSVTQSGNKKIPLDRTPLIHMTEAILAGTDKRKVTIPQWCYWIWVWLSTA